MKHLLLLLTLVACSNRHPNTWKDPAGAFTIEPGEYKLSATIPHNGHLEYHFMKPGAIDGIGIAYLDTPGDYDKAVAQAKPGEYYVRSKKHLFECTSPVNAAALAVCKSLVATD